MHPSRGNSRREAALRSDAQRMISFGACRRKRLTKQERRGADMRECTVEKNKKECNCTYEPCSRKGICCQCLRYHLRSGELPACVFPADVESTYDRSMARFIATYQERRRS